MGLWMLKQLMMTLCERCWDRGEHRELWEPQEPRKSSLNVKAGFLGEAIPRASIKIQRKISQI